ncbi:Translin [Auriculariales sp. MPI-PUGE-AT-0066]|nr:Translin [Auriculariales sp. MPI-PUGE-AT-0066]
MIHAFESFRDDFDAQLDRREKLVKTSREITQSSKKTIFCIDPTEARVSAVRQARLKLRDINTLFAKIAPDVVGEELWRHQRTVSPGIQEYIEAFSFSHYLEFGTLATYQDVQRSLCDNAGAPYFALPLQDYLLGISDLTGELMRFAIVAIARKGGPAQVKEICTFVRNCHSDLENFARDVRELPKKQHVTAESLQKIESALYGVVVRGAEYRGTGEDVDEIIARYAASHSFSGPRKRFAEDEGDERDNDE